MKIKKVDPEDLYWDAVVSEKKKLKKVKARSDTKPGNMSRMVEGTVNQRN